jgi:hypothetical protein
MNQFYPFMKEILPFIRITHDQELAVDAWWQAFKRDQIKICDFFNGVTNIHMDIPALMEESLQSIDYNIMWEFGPGLKKTHRLVITSEKDRQLRYLIQYILSKAPEYKDWEFYEYRLAENLTDTQQTMVSRTNWHDISKITFELVKADYNKIGIIYYLPVYLSQEESYSYNSYILTESLIGEEILDKWIDFIEVRLQPKSRFFRKGNTSALPLSALKETVLKSIAAIKSHLPKTPYFKELSNQKINWCVMKATPLKQEDYPEKQDLYISSFIATKEDLFNATYISQNDFFSERFSNNNEIFLYLKMDGTAEDLNQETFIDRTTIEDTLNDALMKENLGCVIGGGTGLRYSYIDFALTDFTRSIEIIQLILQKGKLTKRSWILFYEAVYQSQWIGVWDDSPPPPV